MKSTRTIANRELFGIVRDTLLEGHTVRVSVNGESMLPFFRSGSTILLRPVREEDIRKYNVVMADAGHAFVVHRIVKIDDDKITLLGDGNIYPMKRDNIKSFRNIAVFRTVKDAEIAKKILGNRLTDLF